MYNLFLQTGTGSREGTPSLSSASFLRLALTCNKIKATIARTSVSIPKRSVLSLSPAATELGLVEVPGVPGAGAAGTVFIK